MISNGSKATSTRRVGKRKEVLDDERYLDFDLYGVAGIRLINPSPADAAAVRTQLGGLEQPLTRDPEILVRFVEHLPTPNLRFIEVNRSGFTDGGFFLLRSGTRPARVRIPFDQIGGACEIVCERGVRSVPLLLDIVKLTALQKGIVPLHASAFEYDGTGILVTGWVHSGKTSALLAFAERGAKYIGDDIMLLSEDGQRMFGIPTPIDFSDWQLDQVPWARHRVSRARRVLFGGINGLDQLQERIPERALGTFYPARFLRNAMSVLRRQLKVELSPVALWEIDHLVSEPQKVFLMMSHEAADVRVEPIDPLRLVERMTHSVHQDLLALFQHYAAYRFAFPEKRNEFIERAHERYAALLRQALTGKEAYTVQSPRPVLLAELYEAMRPFCATAPVAKTAVGEIF